MNVWDLNVEALVLKKEKRNTKQHAAPWAHLQPHENKINLTKYVQDHMRKLQNHNKETKAPNRRELDTHVCEKTIYSPQLDMECQDLMGQETEHDTVSREWGL